MDAALIGQAGARHRLVEDFLSGPIGQGLLWVAGAGEEPAALGMVAPPVNFQLPQEPLRQHGVAVLASLALLDPDLARAAVEVFGPQVAGFVEPQPGPIHCHEEGPMLEIGAAQLEQPGDLGPGIGLGPALGLTRPRQVTFQVRKGPVQYPLVEEAQAANRHVERAGRFGGVSVQVEQIGA